MASQHIEIAGNSTRLNGKLRSFVNHIISAGNLSGELKATFDQVAQGADYEALRNALGLEQDATGTAQAEAIYNLLGGVNTELNATNITQLRGRLG